MDMRKMLSYHRWRKQLRNAIFSPLDPDLASVINHYPEARLSMTQIPNPEEEKVRQQMIDELRRAYKQEEFFRHEKVSEIKRKIGNHEYMIPGKLVVEKWFEKKTEIEF